MEQVFTVNEVADMLKLDRATITSYIKKGYIKAFKVGRQYRITESEINNLKAQFEADAMGHPEDK